VAKFQQVDETRENLDLRARVHEFLRSLSLDSAQKQHKNSFFWFFCLDELLQILSSSAFFVCGIEIFFFFLFIQKQLQERLSNSQKSSLLKVTAQ